MGKVLCANCGNKIGRLDKMKLKIISKSMKSNEKAWQEFQEVKDWCPNCLAGYFMPKFKEAMTELKDKAIPDKAKKVLEKAKKVVGE